MAPPCQQFCLRGHDTYEVGRDASGMCNICDRAKRKLRREAKHVKTNRRNGNGGPWLPFAPLGALLAAEGVRTSHFDSNTARLLARAKARGNVSLYTADEIVCSLGVHPVQVWGEAFYDCEETA